MKKFALIELIISLTFAIVSFVLSIIYKDAMIAAIISATITVVTIINVLNIFRDVSNKASLEEKINSLEGKVVSIEKYFHINELEKLEREFCHTNCDARVFVITNHLTNDGILFLDEIKQNLRKGVTYYYVVSSDKKRDAETLKKDAIEGQKKLDKFFCIETADFSLCPSKYTVVIYDNPASAYSAQQLRGFCCAQDINLDMEVYFRELSFDQTKHIRDNALEIFSLAKQEKLAV